ncbi:MAG: hypothetical protein HC794_09085 [Nitrospiraceae bacterium]|nr:hypothetical protein [Nitrospiraceae bacterium]
MAELETLLLDRDIFLLPLIGELWGVKNASKKHDELVGQVAAVMRNSARVAAMWQGLTEEMRGTLQVLASSPRRRQAKPMFERQDCWFDVPEDQPAECGYLVVPENRRQPGASKVRLPIVILKADPDDDTFADPILYINNPPGVPSSVRRATSTRQPGKSAIASSSLPTTASCRRRKKRSTTPRRPRCRSSSRSTRWTWSATTRRSTRRSWTTSGRP